MAKDFKTQKTTVAIPSPSIDLDIRRASENPHDTNPDKHKEQIQTDSSEKQQSEEPVYWVPRSQQSDAHDAINYWGAVGLAILGSIFSFVFIFVMKEPHNIIFSVPLTLLGAVQALRYSRDGECSGCGVSLRRQVKACPGCQREVSS